MHHERVHHIVHVDLGMRKNPAMYLQISEFWPEAFKSKITRKICARFLVDTLLLLWVKLGYIFTIQNQSNRRWNKDPLVLQDLGNFVFKNLLETLLFQFFCSCQRVVMFFGCVRIRKTGSYYSPHANKKMWIEEDTPAQKSYVAMRIIRD